MFYNSVRTNLFIFSTIFTVALVVSGTVFGARFNVVHAAVVNQNITGYFDGLHPTLSPRLYGWAADQNMHQTQLQVQFWYGPTTKLADAKLAGSVKADLNSDDVKESRGISGSHRFSWSLAPSFAGTAHYWFVFAVNDQGKKVALLQSPTKISIPADAFKTIFAAPTKKSVAVIGKPFPITWNPKLGTPGNMKVDFTVTGDPLFPEVSARYLDGKTTLNLTGCVAFALSESLNCRALRSRISSGLSFFIEGEYTPLNSPLMVIKSDPFKAAYPAGANATCFVNGVYIKNGETKNFYSAASTTALSCNSLVQARTCSNGVMSGDNTKYKHAVCIPTLPVPKTSCTLNGVTLNDGQKRTFYNSASPTTGGRCTFNAQERTCSKGVLSGAATYNKTACTETIMDYNQTWAPTKTPKMFGVFKDTNFAPNTGTTLRYFINQRGQVQASYDTIESSVQRSVFQSSQAVIGNWLGNPSLTSSKTKIATGTKSIALSVSGSISGIPALSIAANGDVTSLRARSYEQMIGEFGALFFPSKEAIPELGTGSLSAKTIFLATPLFKEPIKLNDFSTIQFKVDATLKNAEIKTDCVSGNTLNRNAQKCYDPKIHATQFRVAFGNVQWTDARCSFPNPNDPVCKYHGQFLYFTLGLFDERFEYISGFLQDRPTGSWIYRINLKDFLSGKPAVNPFKIKGKRSVAQGDILALMKEQVLAAEKLGYVPPRLPVNGVLESDEQYLDHYAFSSTNVGYENSGISDITFDVHDLTLIGTRSGLSQSPSCEITITPDSIAKGQSAVLSWKTALADTFSVNNRAVAKTSATSGSVIIKPTESMGYEGLVTGPHGYNKCRTVVQVK